MAVVIRGGTTRRSPCFQYVQLLFCQQRGMLTHGDSLALQDPPCSSSLPSSSRENLNIPSLRYPLPGVKQLVSLPDLTRPNETKLTTLPNGLRIASEDSMGHSISVAFLVDSGCIHESPDSYGATHLLEKMAFKSTRNRTHRQLVQELEVVGAHVSVSSSRDQMSYTANAIKTFMPQIVELLIDSVRNSIFTDCEINEELLKIQTELGEYKKNPQFVLAEALHSVGYSGDYSKSFVASESGIATLNGNSLQDYVNKNFTAPRMVLTASGVEHRDFVAVVEPLLSDLPNIPLLCPPKVDYVGGDWRKQVDSPCTHFALAFAVPGGWQNEKLANSLTVLKFLLGGGGSFSIGGPGKGMYTRLYTRVLNKHDEIQSITAFSSIYNETGLFGIHADSESEFVSESVDIVCKELIFVATPGKVTQKELRRAKSATISSVLMSLESKAVVADDIGRQILSYGHRKPIQDFIDEINNLTLMDIRQAAWQIFSTPMTMASWGAEAFGVNFGSTDQMGIIGDLKDVLG